MLIRSLRGVNTFRMGFQIGFQMRKGGGGIFVAPFLRVSNL